MTQAAPKSSRARSLLPWMGGGLCVFGGALLVVASTPTTAPSGHSLHQQSRRALTHVIHAMPSAAGMAMGFAARPPVSLMSATQPRSVSPPPAGLRGHRARSVWDRPVAEVWPGRGSWTPALEADYGRFVAAIGQGFASHRCHRLDGCLLNPSVNPLYTPGDVRLGLHPDCADLAYVLRAYFAFKRDLPFGWVRTMGGDGGDPRYLMDGTPVAWSQWSRFATAREVLTELSSQVHSGMFRLSPKVEEGDTYAVRIERGSVRPGSVFYDTDGHVLVVYDVDLRGEVFFIDGHPDGSITHKRMDHSFLAGTARWGGGFRNWRPQYVEHGMVLRARNTDLDDYDPQTQYDRASYRIDGRLVRYDEWVRNRLASR